MTLNSVHFRLSNVAMSSEGEGEVAVLSAKRWDSRSS